MWLCDAPSPKNDSLQKENITLELEETIKTELSNELDSRDLRYLKDMMQKKLEYQMLPMMEYVQQIGGLDPYPSLPNSMESSSLLEKSILDGLEVLFQISLDHLSNLF